MTLNGVRLVDRAFTGEKFVAARTLVTREKLLGHAKYFHFLKLFRIFTRHMHPDVTIARDFSTARRLHRRAQFTAAWRSWRTKIPVTAALW